LSLLRIDTISHQLPAHIFTRKKSVYLGFGCTILLLFSQRLRADDRGRRGWDLHAHAQHRHSQCSCNGSEVAAAHFDSSPYQLEIIAILCGFSAAIIFLAENS
jgi:hypothetical protein